MATAQDDVHVKQEPTTRAACTEGPWRRDEVVQLVRAWRQVVAAPAADGGDDVAQSPKMRLFKTFQGFYGGATPRTMRGLTKTKKSLLRSYRFIAVFNQNRIIAKTMSVTCGGQNWFTIPQHEQRRIVETHYKRKPFAYMDEEIFNEIAAMLRNAPHASQPPSPVGADDRASGYEENTATAVAEHAYAEDDRSKAVRAMIDSKRSLAMLPPFRPGRVITAWSRDDVLLLLRVWLEILDGPLIPDESTSAFDTRLFDRFQEVFGGHSTRTPAAVKIKRLSLVKSFKFISDFNRNRIANPVGVITASAVVPNLAKWHALPKMTQKSIIQEYYRKSHFTHVDEDMLPLIASIVKKTSKTSAPDSDEDRAEEGSWTRDEDMLLLGAWRGVVDGFDKTFQRDETVGALDSRICQRFFVLSKGDTARNQKDVTDRQVAMVNTYVLISGFNLSNTSSTDGAILQRPWFSLSKSERQSRISSAGVPCTEIDEDMYTALEQIFLKEKAAVNTGVDAPLPTSATATSTWSRSEVVELLRAWLEVVTDGALAEDEPVHVFNSRIYSKFIAQTRGIPMRTEREVISKRESIIHSFQFITDYNRKRPDAASESNIPEGNDWFSNSHDDQRQLVKAHYKSGKFSFLYRDMLPVVQEIVEKSELVESLEGTSAITAVSQATSDSGSLRSPSSPWGLPATLQPSAGQQADSPPTKRKSDDATLRVLAESASPTGSKHGLVSSSSKKQKRTLDIQALASIVEAQTKYLNDLLVEMAEERKLQGEERQQMLELIQLDQEERRRDREDRKLEREQLALEWEQFREERRVEGEQDRALLSEFLGQLS
ncbi:hypothetical protein FI667_g17344, partial [Globisporangium splendens]